MSVDLISAYAPSISYAGIDRAKAGLVIDVVRIEDGAAARVSGRSDLASEAIVESY